MESNAFFSVDFYKKMEVIVERDIELYPQKTKQEQLDILKKCVLQGMSIKSPEETAQRIAETLKNVAILSRWDFKESILLMAAMIAECPILIIQVLDVLEVSDVTLQ